MQVVQLPEYNRNVLRALLSLKVIHKEIPKPQNDEVLVKMHAASCNPSDIAFIQGGYNIVKTLPTVPGFEGSGIVVETGSEAKDLLDKKVCCFIQTDIDGTWAEYFKLKRENLVVLDEVMDLDQAACFSVNPFTAFALIDIAEIKHCKTIIQNAAGGQVPALIRLLAKKRGIETINIVRKPITAERLKKEGVKHVLVEQDDDCFEKLEHLANKLNATVAFDAVGGPLAGLIFNSMPSNSELVVYGGLSNKPISEINTMDIIFQNKIITGFNLMGWKTEIGHDEYLRIVNELQKLFISGQMTTKIQDCVSLENIIQGLKTYLGNMSDGKILIKP